MILSLIPIRKKSSISESKQPSRSFQCGDKCRNGYLKGNGTSGNGENFRCLCRDPNVECEHLNFCRINCNDDQILPFPMAEKSPERTGEVKDNYFSRG